MLLGVDEAGRGPLAGPVVAAAVALPEICPDDLAERLDDSKRLSEKKREALFEPIRQGALAWGVAIVDHLEIDRLNILRASLEAMVAARERALEQCRGDTRVRDALVLVDGKMPAPLPRGVAQRPIIKGDARSLNIAAASVLAKVTRDRLMVAYEDEFPGYGFAKHKGYPTRAHREAIARLGPAPIHRRSFKLPERLEPS